MKRIFVLFPVLILWIFTACSPEASSSTPKIEVGSPYITAVMAMDMSPTSTGDSMGMTDMGGGNAAAFMVIKNSGGTADRLIKAQCDVAKSTELHQTTMKDNIMSMQPVDGIDIPSNGQVELKSGSYHVMLIDLTKKLNVGDKVKIILTFEKAGMISVDAEVRNP
jgi:copper(I)-binding protein